MILELKEYQTVSISDQDLPQAIGHQIWSEYSDKIQVEFPTPATDNYWRLTPQGWAGFIPLSQDYGLSLLPKVNLTNLFGMLEYAYKLKSFQFIEGLFEADSLNEFYQRLAKILSLRVLDRGRKGFYRNYVHHAERLPFLKGRMDVYKKSKPWDPMFHCLFEEFTPDLEENQILTWTLYKVARSGLCGDDTMAIVRKAYRELQKIVSVKLIKPQSCINRLYNRLNEDYRLLHALCRFFLESSGPSHKVGDREMIPFLVNMERLFELFIAEWLKQHLPGDYIIKPQEQVFISSDGQLKFNVDLVLYDTKSGNPLCVLDTKYKIPDSPSTDDVAKVAAYAMAKGCNKAFLIYPETVNSAQITIGSVHVNCLAFSIKDSLEKAGEEFIRKLIESSVRVLSKNSIEKG